MLKTVFEPERSLPRKAVFTLGRRALHCVPFGDDTTVRNICAFAQFAVMEIMERNAEMGESAESDPRVFPPSYF